MDPSTKVSGSMVENKAKENSIGMMDKSMRDNFIMDLNMVMVSSNSKILVIIKANLILIKFMALVIISII